MAHQINRNQKVNFENINEFAWSKILELHPKETWPDWFKKCISLKVTLDANYQWVISLDGVKNEPLEPNYFEEEFNGRRRTIYLDPITGKKYVVLCIAPKTIITVFKAVINPDTAEVTVLVDSDFSRLVGKDFSGFDRLPPIEIKYQSIWLEPVINLDFKQLKKIKDLFGFNDLNIVSLKKKFCDNQKHLLSDKIHPDDISEKVNILSAFNIPFSIQ